MECVGLPHSCSLWDVWGCPTAALTMGLPQSGPNGAEGVVGVKQSQAQSEGLWGQRSEVTVGSQRSEVVVGSEVTVGSWRGPTRVTLGSEVTGFTGGHGGADRGHGGVLGSEVTERAEVTERSRQGQRSAAC